MSVPSSNHPVRPWASMLDFVDLPEGGVVLCAGDDAPGMVCDLHDRGHRGVAFVDDAAGDGAAQDGGIAVAGRLHALPVRDGAFTAILCAGVLHRQDNPEATLEELRRVLQPGGLLVIHEPLATAGGGAGHLSAQELCAHLAGEQFAVMAHRQEPAVSGVPVATWVLRAPMGPAENTSTRIEADR